jgi:hypothetical protein
MFQVEDVPLVGPQLHSGWGQVNCVGCRVSEGGWMGTGQLLAI